MKPHMTATTISARLGALALASALVLGTTACTPVTSFQGFQAIEEKPQDVKVKIDTKSVVLARLGSPTAVSTFDPNLWFYMAQTKDTVAFYHPSVRERSIVAIAFDKDLGQWLYAQGR